MIKYILHQIKRVMRMLKNKKAHLKTPLGRTESFQITRGSPQGDPISAIIFSIFINPLLECMTKEVRGYKFFNNDEINIHMFTLCWWYNINSRKSFRYAKIMDIVQKFSEQTGLTLHKC